ncbi:MAG TPA: MFS transporter [Candidatus Krumholzibacteria bacterium]|nr:MFS transporter [Candidatus Krumholzibacteria bacterium]HPD72557.1 MFS transporter [Candidatus Krumholzibacteria bacterium]HRY40511.1 MFS transporter [Candidatus Krumholzibacteria bacterium]
MADPRAVRAWCLYDWANSAFACTVMAALFPPFFRAIAEADGLAPAAVTARWGLVTGLALLVVALGGPVLGALGDALGARKRLLAAFMASGVLATAGFALLPPTNWRLAGGAFALANLGFAGSLVFYESLLLHVAPRGQLDTISARGYAWGYLGGGLLLIVNMLWVTMPGAFGFAGAGAAVKASFLSVAGWWAIFSVPLFRYVAEPAPVRRGPASRVWRDGFGQLGRTWRDLRGYRPLLLLLLAYWLYNDGIGTIIKMATAYGGEIGIGTASMIQALVVTQLIGVPSTLLCGRLAARAGARPVLAGGLAVYAVVCVLGFFMSAAWHFFLLAALVGTVQGACQALSRSLFGTMVPRHKSAEFFGFYSTSGKLAGIFGPLAFAAVSHLTGQSRLSILLLIGLFASGAWLLLRVDLEAGRRQARIVEERDGQVERPAADHPGVE